MKWKTEQNEFDKILDLYRREWRKVDRKNKEEVMMGKTEAKETEQLPESL